MASLGFLELLEGCKCVSIILNFAAFEGVDGRDSFEVSVFTTSCQRLISDRCWMDGMVGIGTSCSEDSLQEVSDVATDDLDLAEAENTLEARDISDATEDLNKLLAWEVRAFVRSGIESSQSSSGAFCCGLELFTIMLLLRALFCVWDAEIPAVNVAVIGMLLVVLFDSSFKSRFRRVKRLDGCWRLLSVGEVLSFASSLVEMKYGDLLKEGDGCCVSAAVCPGSWNGSTSRCGRAWKVSGAENHWRGVSLARESSRGSIQER